MLEVWSSEWHAQVEDSSQTGAQWMVIRSLGSAALGRNYCSYCGTLVSSYKSSCCYTERLSLSPELFCLLVLPCGLSLSSYPTMKSLTELVTCVWIFFHAHQFPNN